MNYRIIEDLQGLSSDDCLLIAVKPGHKLILGNYPIAKNLKTHLQTILASNELGEECGSSLYVHLHSDDFAMNAILVTIGEESPLSAKAYQDLLDNAFAEAKSMKREAVASLLMHIPVSGLSISEKIAKNVTSFAASHYQYLNRKSRTSRATLSLLCKKSDKACKDGLKLGEALAAGIKFTKDLGNTPPNTCTPSYMAKQATALSKEYSSLKTTIIDEAGMKKLGMGALLAVSQGSIEPAKFIVMEYQGAAKSKAPIVLVGKGVTFDSGGTSLKPPVAMMEMKYDMLGAGSVFGTIKALCELKAKKNVIAITPCTENMPGAKAVKPGDVVKSMAGINIEILNTDAEGRLILCDALCYAQKFKPRMVIDLATLTGAAIAAFGHHTQPIMGNNQQLVDNLIKQFNRVGERAWQLPLFPEYDKELKSKVADVANIAPVNSRLAGTIHSACFLKRFTNAYDWAHIDIAGTSFNSRQLATGRPVAALTQFVLNDKG